MMIVVRRVTMTVAVIMIIVTKDDDKIHIAFIV